MDAHEPGKRLSPHWIREMTSILRVAVVILLAILAVLVVLYVMYRFQAAPVPFPGHPLPTTNPDGS
jgi:hypothetical protein